MADATVSIITDKGSSSDVSSIKSLYDWRDKIKSFFGMESDEELMNFGMQEIMKGLNKASSFTGKSGDEEQDNKDLSRRKEAAELLDWRRRREENRKLLKGAKPAIKNTPRPKGRNPLEEIGHWYDGTKVKGTDEHEEDIDNVIKAT
jgi:hypothetical protein